MNKEIELNIKVKVLSRIESILKEQNNCNSFKKGTIKLIYSEDNKIIPKKVEISNY